MNRKEWLLWRQGGIGSSDANIIMGESKHSTLFDLYEGKTDPNPKEETSFITEKGNRFEPRIRSLFELYTGQSFEPAVLQSAELDYIRASLDGRSKDKKKICEIKLIGANDFMLAKETNSAPPQYKPQMQHQLMVSGAVVNFFVGYVDNGGKLMTIDNLAIVPVEPDVPYQSHMLKREVDFWENNVLKRVPPPFVDADFRVLRGVTEEASKLAELRKQIRELEDPIIDACEASGHDRVRVAGLRFHKSKDGWYISNG